MRVSCKKQENSKQPVHPSLTGRQTWYRHSRTMEMTMGSTLTKASIAFAVVLVGSSIGTFLYNRHTPDPLLDPFPERLDSRIEVHPGEQVRIVEYHEDGLHKERGTSTNEDGSTADLRYGPNNEVIQKVVSYPGEGGRIKQFARMTPDGKDYEFNVEFHANGMLSELTCYLDATTYSVRRFTASGITTFDQVQIQKNKVWLVRDERRFDDDGVMRFVTHMSESGAVDTKQFYRNTKLQSHSQITSTRELYTRTTYLEDGTTVTSTLKQDPDQTVLAKVLSEGGSEIRKWSRDVTRATMQLEIYDERGTLRMSQWWGRDQAGKPKIESVRVFDQGGKQTRLIMYRPDGITVATDIHLHSKTKDLGERTIYNYRPDGTLESIRELDDDNKDIGTREFKPEENIRAEVDPALVSWRDFEMPEQIVTPRPVPFHH